MKADFGNLPVHNKHSGDVIEGGFMARLYVAAQVYRKAAALQNVSYRHGWMRRAKLGNREGGIGAALFDFRLFFKNWNI